jgi:selenocysteine lyase/cysteine desulfurase
LEASLNLLRETGIKRIAAYLSELTDYLCERLANSHYKIISSRLEGEKSQIVCIEHSGEWTSMALYQHLRKQSIIAAPRGTRLRISPHLYNTTEDIDALVEALP